MLKEAHGVKRFIIKTGRTDLRYGIDRLAAMIRIEYNIEPLQEGTLFLFCGRKKDRIKCLLYESDGFLLITKRVTDGGFIWPKNENEVREMTRDNFQRLLGGYEIESFTKVHRRLEAAKSDKKNGENSLENRLSDEKKALERAGLGRKKQVIK